MNLPYVYSPIHIFTAEPAAKKNAPLLADPRYTVQPTPFTGLSSV